jgi:hypothetical protein
MGLICPHCEKPLGAEHDAKACRRRMSRRFFFGLTVAPLVAVIAAKLPSRAPLVPRSICWWKAQTELPAGGAGLQMEWIVAPVGIEAILAEMQRDGQIAIVETIEATMPR